MNRHSLQQRLSDAPVKPAQNKKLALPSTRETRLDELAGEKIPGVLTHSPGHGASIGGLNIVAAGGWFTAHPSGTEDICKIHAEDLLGAEHLRRLLAEVQAIVDAALVPG